jgi:putative salt-induced outer membrane protein YdiY/sRNA-binding regulator protein Hfq
VRRSAILRASLCVWVSIFLFTLAASADQVTLKNGDRLTGTIVKSDGKTLLLKTDSAGEITLKWDAVSDIVSSQPLSVQLKNGQVVSGNVTTEDGKFEVATRDRGQVAAPRDNVVAIRNAAEQSDYDRLQHPRIIDLWSGLLDTGLSETRGNSALLAFNLAGKAARVSTRDKISLYSNVIYATDNSTPPSRTTANSIQGGARYDYNLKPRIFVFAIADFAYDEFQHLDLRSVLGGGLGYHVIKTENITFDVFAGGDYDREKFSPNPPLVLTNVTRDVAEVVAGEELSWKLNNRVSLNERFSAFPNLSDLGQYRFQFDATAATKLKRWLSWQITVSDRYLSNPLPGLKSNDELLSTGLRLTFGKGAL